MRMKKIQKSLKVKNQTYLVLNKLGKIWPIHRLKCHQHQFFRKNSKMSSPPPVCFSILSPKLRSNRRIIAFLFKFPAPVSLNLLSFLLLEITASFCSVTCFLQESSLRVRHFHPVAGTGG